jgi:hypothetical protein
MDFLEFLWTVSFACCLALLVSNLRQRPTLPLILSNTRWISTFSFVLNSIHTFFEGASTALEGYRLFIYTCRPLSPFRKSKYHMFCKVWLHLHKWCYRAKLTLLTQENDCGLGIGFTGGKPDRWIFMSSNQHITGKNTMGWSAMVSCVASQYYYARWNLLFDFVRLVLWTNLTPNLLYMKYLTYGDTWKSHRDRRLSQDWYVFAASLARG